MLLEFWAQTPHQVLLGHTSSLVSYGPPSNLVYPEKFCPFPMGFMGCGSFLFLVVPRVPATGRGATCVGRRGGAGTGNGVWISLPRFDSCLCWVASGSL